jgi:hypothetical protein
MKSRREEGFGIIWTYTSSKAERGHHGLKSVPPC